MRTAQGGLIHYDEHGNRLVSPTGIERWRKVKTDHNNMLIIHAHQVIRVHGGYQLNFRVVDQYGQLHNSNLFIGDKNKMAKHHARILRISEAELKEPKVLEEALNNLVGRCLGYTHYKQWIRPIQTCKCMRLDEYLRLCDAMEEIYG